MRATLHRIDGRPSARRRWSPSRRRLLVGAAGALGVSLLGGWGRASAQATVEPNALYQALLETPFEAGELPDGFTFRDSRQIQAEHVGLVGGVAVGLRGPEYEQQVWYYVFGTEADALQHFDDSELGRRTLGGGGPSSGSQLDPRTTITDAFVPPDFEQPAWCVAGRSFVGGRTWPWTVCTVLVGNVEVGGSCRSQPGPPLPWPMRSDSVNAIALARAAAQHLARVRERLGQA